MMDALKFLFPLSLLLVSTSCSHLPMDQSVVREFIVTPNDNGHKEFLTAIQKAKKSVWMKMYHLTDPQIIEELKSAQKRNIDLKILLDGSSLTEKKFQSVFADLKKNGVNVRASSTCFSITHEKSMIVDASRAFITSINLTRSSNETRDYGVITDQADIIKEMDEVFTADWNNAEKNTCTTPALTLKNLLWSPVNAEERLVNFIGAAQNTIYATVENLGNKKIEKALIERSSLGVDVRIIVPQCDKNKDPLFNYPFIQKLTMANVHVHVMPHPSSAEKPYMHAKMILIDESAAYVGSINFSNNSLTRARELGILFNDNDAVEKIKKEFGKDWNNSIAPVPLKKDFCPAL